ncbi:MAG: coproporphyrinogen III oxidase, partial [Agathobacter rectalis]
KEQMEEFMFLGLRMNEGVTREAFERAFGISIDAIYKDTIDSLKKQELLVVKDGHIYLSERGKDVANYVMAQFLRD